MTKELLSKVWYDELPDLQEIYNQAKIFARTVGYIDWEFPMPEDILEDYYMRREMYCVRGQAVGVNPGYPEEPVAAVRLSTEQNPQIWQDGVKALYIGKMAVGHDARKLGVATRVIIPEACEIARSRGLDEIRLDCLADNERLKSFYRRSFTEQGDVTINNAKGEDLLLTRFNRPVTPKI